MDHEKLAQRLRIVHAINVTPFREDRGVDYDLLEWNIEFLIASSLGVIAVLPTSRTCWRSSTLSMTFLDLPIWFNPWRPPSCGSAARPRCGRHSSSRPVPRGLPPVWSTSPRSCRDHAGRLEKRRLRGGPNRLASRGPDRESWRARNHNGNNVSVIKEGMNLTGLPAGLVREPLGELDEADRQELTQILRSWGKLA